MQPMLNIAVTAATQAGKLINQYYDRYDAVKTHRKGYNDFVTEVDQKAEQCILYHIETAYPEHSIIAEESGARGQHDFCWIIDPLDGTANFMHGFPQFAVSIAIQHQGEIKAGVVYDPLSNELFTATKGTGARMNNRRMRVSKAEKLSSCLIGTGFPFKEPDKIDDYIKIFRPMIEQASGIRRAGAAALDLAYVAAGRLDGFWEDGLKIWDMAAGVLLIQEAGGVISDFSGESDYLNSGNLVTANKQIHQHLLNIIQSEPV